MLDLRGALDHKPWEQQAVEAAGMRYIRVGLSGFFAPTEHQIDKILEVLDNPALGPIFIHCRRGADRSGLVIACYRITHDHWTNAQAMREARQQGFSGLEILMHRYIDHFKVASLSAGRSPAAALGHANPPAYSGCTAMAASFHHNSAFANPTASSAR